MQYKTASVEVLEGQGTRAHLCDMCQPNRGVPPAYALYNVFDGNVPKYACGRHLTLAVHAVATRK